MKDQKQIIKSLKHLKDMLEDYCDLVDIDEAEKEEGKSKDKSKEKED